MAKAAAELKWLFSSMLRDLHRMGEGENSGNMESAADARPVSPESELFVTESSLDIFIAGVEEFIFNFGVRLQSFAELAGRSEVTASDFGRCCASKGLVHGYW